MNNKNWININSINNYNKILAITNNSLNIETEKKIITESIEYIKNLPEFKNNNTIKQKIKAFMDSQNQDPIIIKKIYTEKNKIENKINNLSELLKKLNINDYKKYFLINKKSNKNFQLSNLDDFKKIEYPNTLNEIINNLLKTKMETENVLKSEKELYNYGINYALKSIFSVKNYDLTIQSIGNINDILGFGFEMITKQKNFKDDDLIPLNDFKFDIAEIFKFYLKDNYDEFKNFVSVYPFRYKFKNNDGEKIDYIIYTNKNTPSKAYSINPGSNTIYDYIKKAIEENIKTPNDNAKEFLIVILKIFFMQIDENLKIILNKFNDYQKLKKKNLDYVVESYKKNLEKFRELYEGLVYLFIGLDDRSKYKIETADDNRQFINKGTYRFIGNLNDIPNQFIYSESIYPLIPDNNSIDKFINLFHKDIKNHKDEIVFLGSTYIENNIAKLVFQTLIYYYQFYIKLYKSHIKFIDEYSDKFKKAIPKKTLKEYKNIIESRFKELPGAINLQNKNMRANIAIKYIINKYKKLKDEENKNFIQLNLIEHKINQTNKYTDQQIEGLFKLRQIIFQQLNIYQLNAYVFKKLAINIYQGLIKKNGKNIYLEEYLDMLKDEFNKVDAITRNDLRTEFNKTRYNKELKNLEKNI